MIPDFTDYAFDIIPDVHRKFDWEILIIPIMGFLAFGFQIPFLGFFQDDWNFVYYSQARGPQGLLELTTIDGRPGGVWVYILGFAILGYEPALWQLVSLVFRILTAITFFLILEKFLPNRRHGNLIASILFLIYPFFTLQPLAVTFSEHFVAYFLFGLSLLFMLNAVEKPRRYLAYSSVAVLAVFVHLFTVEYFVGLELLRPLLLWLFMKTRQGTDTRASIKKIIASYLPYLAALAAFILWRGLFVTSFGVRNNPLVTILDSGQRIETVFRNFFADLSLMLITSWFKVIDPELFVLGPIRNYYILVIVLIGVAAFYLFSRTSRQNDASAISGRTIFLAGLVCYLAGILAAYAIAYIVHEKIPPWNSRFSLPVLPGLALMTTALLDKLIQPSFLRHGVLTVLIGLLIGMHNQNMFNFKTAWEKQERFYQQLLWRAPDIQPNTAIVASEEILGYMGDYPTSSGINTMYESNSINPIPYWFFTLSAGFKPIPPENSDLGEPLSASKPPAYFHGNTRDAIYINFEPENNQCLWVLRPQDSEYKGLPSGMRSAALDSRIENIATVEKEHKIFQSIVGEDRDTWCYYYQKADRARQSGDWTTITQLWDQARNNGWNPDHGFEYLPFIEAYARLGQWEEAFKLTKTSNQVTGAMYFILCPTWSTVSQETPESNEKKLYLENINTLLRCEFQNSP